MEGMVEMSLHIRMQIGYKQTARQSNGKKPLPIDFDTKEGTYFPTGENQKYLSRVVGTHVRQFVHPYFDRWANVPEEQKARTTSCVYEFFDVNPRRYSKADYKLIVDSIEDTAARRYSQYKADVNAYIRDRGTAVLYRGLTTDVWEKCIERSSSQKFKRDRQTQEWPSVIETFKVNHQRNGEWVNEKAAQDYVLGERRGHRRAVGRVLRGTSRSHSSTTRLRDQHSTSQSTKATNALKSKMETYMHQMNEFMTLLTSNLQSVMPGIQLPTPPPPPPLSPMHEEELDSSNDEYYLSDL
ncbi:Uncharacterized protein Adt_35282 [Abeliophyllum distichum]|uniref:Transposase, Ptta/En/Spm, plant n=1 Tax=Abeliophyllum distichum TaxID=126358 RepID=A0ABD1QE91_9LAMI